MSQVQPSIPRPVVLVGLTEGLGVRPDVSGQVPRPFLLTLAPVLFGIVYPRLPYHVASNSQDGARFDSYCFSVGGVPRGPLETCRKGSHHCISHNVRVGVTVPISPCTSAVCLGWCFSREETKDSSHYACQDPRLQHSRRPLEGLCLSWACADSHHDNESL